MKRISVLVVLAVGLAVGLAGCGGTSGSTDVPIIPQVTVFVTQGGLPLKFSPVVEATGDDGKSPPSPTGVIATQNTDDTGKTTFTLPATVPGGFLCFSSKIIYSGNATGYSFVQNCKTVNDLLPVVILDHAF